MQKVELSPEHIKLATDAITSIDPSLKTSYLRLVKFLALNPKYRGKLRGNTPPRFASAAYFEKTAMKFVQGRTISKPKRSSKVTDPLLVTLFQSFASVSDKDVTNAVRQHSDFMLLENVVGKLLEHYLASRLEPLGWTWCSGDFAQKVDFIKLSGKKYEVLQIKNKDVTENSSSSAGRGNVPKWSRLKGKTAQPSWSSFPDTGARKVLSESDFLKYSKQICASW